MEKCILLTNKHHSRVPNTPRYKFKVILGNKDVEFIKGAGEMAHWIRGTCNRL